MTPDSWMPFYGDDFNNATKMFPPAVKWAYLECLWYFWSHTKCTGLPDDDDMLRRLCDCEAATWARTRGMIFCGKPFFYLESGKWHQSRAIDLYAEAVAGYKAKSDAGKKGNEVRWGRKPVADASLCESLCESHSDGVEIRKPVADASPENRKTMPSGSQLQPQPHLLRKGVPRSITSAEMIKSEKELVRAIRELEKLGDWRDYAEGSSKRKRFVELQGRILELRNSLGVKA